MPIYIDESGDTGHAKDSSPFFRLAAVRLPSLVEAEALRDAIRGVRRELQIDSAHEFKFAKSHSRPDIRRAFFRAACGRGFRFAACSIDKTAAHWRVAGSEEIHWAAATCLAVSMRAALHRAENSSKPLDEPLIVDDSGDQRFLKAIAAAFRGLKSIRHPAMPMVRKPKFRDSSTDEIMQLVDMLCGAMGAYLKGDLTWYEMVEANCEGFICLP